MMAPSPKREPPGDIAQRQHTSLLTLAAGVEDTNPRLVDDGLQALLRLESQQPGTIEHSTDLREAALVAAHATYDGLFSTDLPYSLIGALVSVMALITVWTHDPLLKLGRVGWAVGGAIVLLTVTIVLYAVRTYFRQRRWRRCSDRVKLLLQVLQQRPGPQASLTATALQQALAGAPLR